MKTIAAFDFDGTLTNRDSLIPFLHWLFGRAATFHLSLELPALLACRLFSRTKAKERIFSRFFRGIPLEDLKRKGEMFAREKIPSLLSPEGREAIAWHQTRGHRCILISASLDVYLQPWAALQGFDVALTSSLECDLSGKITGKLSGANCRDEEKVRRLIEWAGPKSSFELYAYGNSSGDHALLDVADHAFYRFGLFSANRPWKVWKSAGARYS